MQSPLEVLSKALLKPELQTSISSYYVPRFLVERTGACDMVDVGNPFTFYRNTIQKILLQPQIPPDDGLVYSSFIRYTSGLNFETGSALKQIAFLPYLRDKIGVGTVIFLPTSQIGFRDKKGLSGSPFATMNPFQTDLSLADPLLQKFSATQQYKFLISACHYLSVRVGSIVPLATLAVDAPALIEEPALTYWWRHSSEDKMYRSHLPRGTPPTN